MNEIETELLASKVSMFSYVEKCVHIQSKVPKSNIDLVFELKPRYY